MTRAPASVDAAEWKELVRTVHRQMRSLVGPGHRDLEDLTQAALEQLVTAMPRFEGRAQSATFTYRVCAHVAMNHWRGWRRWLRRFRFWEEDDVEARGPCDVDRACAEGERALRLHACLERLSPVKRVCVTLADLEELPASQIAQVLDCPEPTVRSRLAAARAELVAHLRRDPAFASETFEGEP